MNGTASSPAACPVAVFASAAASSPFVADDLLELVALSFAACAAVASDALLSDCCACTGAAALTRASAIADAIGVFLSFMNFPP